MNEAGRSLLLKTMLLLSLIGLAITTYQTYEHYFQISSVCDLSATFSCSAVTESRFGEFPPSSGIATSAWGIPWWVILSVLIYGSIGKKEWFKMQDFYILVWAVIGSVFVIYLLITELYILPSEIGELIICPLCTAQHIIIAIILVSSLLILRKPFMAYLGDIFLVKK